MNEKLQATECWAGPGNEAKEMFTIRKHENFIAVDAVSVACIVSQCNHDFWLHAGILQETASSSR